ncbi:hypothetical protein [Stakelama marina]|uniref:Haem-binding uptake Tiki superfamily ChaN domain-containing protein n=1 Tax=Stakelama marina TaxID=2826939 RepID=A0A8T4IAU2_9SPHN|nr:hypothetical protein [Stakelama marina]MBR0551232.1 hypothetical protein [Stakelama marina]
MLRAAAFIATAMVAGTASPASAEPSCKVPPGWSTIVQTEAKYIVFGELHGTSQSPAMVGNIACALAGKGESVLVAVEMEASANDALQRVWQDAGQDFQDRLISDMPGWRGRDDGVASQALLGMLSMLHDRYRAGARLRVVAFNGMHDDRQRRRLAHLPVHGPHEAAQAENILNAAQAAPYDHVLILVGSMHARRIPVSWAGTSYRPMRMHLPSDTVSLRMTYSGGDAWNCQVSGQHSAGEPIAESDIDCGPHPVRGDWHAEGVPRISLGALPKGRFDLTEAFDGQYFVGAITASTPAAAISDEPETESRFGGR